MLPIVTDSGQRISLADVANVFVEDGPPAIKSENARLNGWTFVDIEDVGRGQLCCRCTEGCCRKSQTSTWIFPQLVRPI